MARALEAKKCGNLDLAKQYLMQAKVNDLYEKCSIKACYVAAI
jgi:hypothetical protein